MRSESALVERTQMSNIQISNHNLQVYSKAETFIWQPYSYRSRRDLALRTYYWHPYLRLGSPPLQHNHTPIYPELLWTKQIAFTIPADKQKGHVWNRLTNKRRVRCNSGVNLGPRPDYQQGLRFSWPIIAELLDFMNNFIQSSNTSGNESCRESMKREIA